MTIKLTTGEKLTLRTSFTHRMHRDLFKALNKGVVWKQNLDTGDYEKEVPAENVELQYEAVMPLIIEKIEKGSTAIPFSQDWLDDLPQEDYRKLEEAVASIRNGPTVTDAEGEKKA